MFPPTPTFDIWEKRNRASIYKIHLKDIETGNTYKNRTYMEIRMVVYKRFNNMDWVGDMYDLTLPLDKFLESLPDSDKQMIEDYVSSNESLIILPVEEDYKESNVCY